MNVVVIDDRELNLRYLRNIVSEIPEVTVHPFTSSADALAWCVDRDVDCFVIDYAMPPPDGITMVRLLREMERFATVPIVIVTGALDREVRYRAFDAGATDFITKPFDRREMVARLGTMLALRSAKRRLALQVGWLEASLLDSEERAREHADRLEALSRLVNDPEPDEGLTQTMLRQATAAIRRDQAFVGLLSRVETDEIVAEAVAGELPAPLRATLHAGARWPIEPALAAETLRRGRTLSSDDIGDAGDVPRAPHEYPWRAAIATPFRVDETAYVLSFASAEPAHRPFRAQDHTYVEILAQFFATHVQAQLRSAHIRHQLDRDALTSLWNRSRFRSLGRAELHAERPAAVAVIDLVDFHRINETQGHRAGDRVLVEAAAALAGEAGADEIVARVGGDSFAVLLPQFASHTDLLGRIARFTECVPVAAVVGIAVSPADGDSIDDLLLRAEARSRPSYGSRR